MVNLTEEEDYFIKEIYKEIYMKENLKTVIRMEKGNIAIEMEISMWVIL